MKMMNRNASRFPRVLFVVALAVFGLPLFTFAQTTSSGTFIVKPAKVEVELAPGEEQTVRLHLANGTAVPLHVETSFEDIAPVSQERPTDEAVQLLGEGKSNASIKDSLSVSRTSFDILSLHELEVPVTVTIPKNAVPGGRYGSVVFTFTPALSGADSAQNIAVQNRVAVILYIRVKGDVSEEGKLVKFGVFNDARVVAAPSATHPIRFQVAYENTGKVYENPHGAITLKNIFGNTRSQLLIDPFAVLPGATRMREIDQLEPLAPGYYTAEIALSRGYGTVIDFDRVSFVVLPTFRFAAITLTILILLALLIRRSLRISRSSLS